MTSSLVVDVSLSMIAVWDAGGFWVAPVAYVLALNQLASNQ